MKLMGDAVFEVAAPGQQDSVTQTQHCMSSLMLLTTCCDHNIGLRDLDITVFVIKSPNIDDIEQLTLGAFINVFGRLLINNDR